VKSCIQIRAEDNVANVLEAAEKDDSLSVAGLNSGSVVVATEYIRCFHKVALLDISEGADVVRDGYIIGRTKTAIRRGEWVHVHNLESKRA
jgi:hypothetical protein